MQGRAGKQRAPAAPTKVGAGHLPEPTSWSEADSAGPFSRLLAASLAEARPAEVRPVGAFAGPLLVATAAHSEQLHLPGHHRSAQPGACPDRSAPALPERSGTPRWEAAPTLVPAMDPTVPVPTSAGHQDAEIPDAGIPDAGARHVVPPASEAAYRQQDEYRPEAAEVSAVECVPPMPPWLLLPVLQAKAAPVVAQQR